MLDAHTMTSILSLSEKEAPGEKGANHPELLSEYNYPDEALGFFLKRGVFRLGGIADVSLSNAGVFQSSLDAALQNW